MVQNLVAGGEELAVLLTIDPLRGRHGRLRYANPQGTSVGLSWGALAVRRGIRRGWQHHPVTEVACEGCCEAWAYGAHKIRTGGVGSMTGGGLILLLFQHSRTLQGFPRKRESSATPPRACVTCRIPGRIPCPQPGPTF